MSDMYDKDEFINYDEPTTRRSMTMNTNTDLNSLSFDNLVPTNSQYLKQTDVGEEGVVLTIRGFKQELLENDEGGKEAKIIMYFQEDYKPMVLNRTNSQLLGVATGAANAGEARGKQVIVYADPTVGFGGKITGGLRIRKYSTASPTIPRQADKPLNKQGIAGGFDDLENNIPF